MCNEGIINLKGKWLLLCDMSAKVVLMIIVGASLGIIKGDFDLVQMYVCSSLSLFLEYM